MTPADLRSARHALGLTQKGLARELRMGTHGWQSISKWENDASSVPGPVSVAVQLLLERRESTGAVPMNRASPSEKGRGR